MEALATSSVRGRPATSARSTFAPGSSRRRRLRRAAAARFVSMQNHYNLVYREEEREMIPLCIDQGVARHPLQPAGPRLARPGTRSQGDGEIGAAYPPRQTSCTGARATWPWCEVVRAARGRRATRPHRSRSRG